MNNTRYDKPLSSHLYLYIAFYNIDFNIDVMIKIEQFWVFFIVFLLHHT